MHVIAINEYENDWPVAVVQIPENMTGDETFVAWVRKKNPKHWDGKLDEDVLNEAMYVFSELTVEVL